MAEKDKEQPATAQDAPSPSPEPAKDRGGKKGKANRPVTDIQTIKENAREEDPKPSSNLTLRKIIGGDILTATFVRRQIWLLVLIVTFAIVYVAFRYQCQQDLITIDKLESELKDAKYKALSSSSTLTERCRESHILEILKNNKDSLLHTADQPPYIITVPDK